MLHGGVVVPADVAHRHLSRPGLCSSTKKNPERERPAEERSRSPAPHAMVDLEVSLDRVPWLLGNHSNPDAELGHDLRKTWRHGRGIGASAEGAARRRTNVPAGLAGLRAALHVPLSAPSTSSAY